MTEYYVFKYKNNYLSKDRTGKVVQLESFQSSNLKFTVHDMAENYLHNDTALIFFNTCHQYEVTIEKVKFEE